MIVDSQNDFLSEGGVVRDPVGDGVRKTRVVEHPVALRAAAGEAGIPVFHSPHYYSDEEYGCWAHLNPIDRILFDRKMFRKGTWGAKFHPDFEPGENTIVLPPHKALSNFRTGDINLQLRQRKVQTVIRGRHRPADSAGRQALNPGGATIDEQPDDRRSSCLIHTPDHEDDPGRGRSFPINHLEESISPGNNVKKSEAKCFGSKIWSLIRKGPLQAV